MTVAPDFVLELSYRSLIHHLVVLYSEPSVGAVRRILVKWPGEIVRAFPEGVLRRPPLFEDIGRLFDLREVRVKCANMVMKETQRRIINNVGRNDQVIWVGDLSGNKLRDSIIIDPYLWFYSLLLVCLLCVW
jgi:hypothetical protein